MTATPTNHIAVVEVSNITVPGTAIITAVIVAITAAPVIAVGVSGHGRNRHQGGKSQYQADSPCHFHWRFLE
jgi:hypothetical protein